MPRARVSGPGRRAGALLWLALCAGAWSGTALGAKAAAGAAPAAASADAPAPAGKTVMVLGDSISAGYGFGLEKGWVNLLRERLAPAHRVVNASGSGYTTTDGLVRLDRLLAEHRPDIVIIELGGNDGLRGLPVAELRANLATLAERSLASGAETVLAGMRIHPNYGLRYTEAFHRAFAEVAEETGATLVPFLLEGVATTPSLMQPDGTHPNAAAQPRLLENIWPALAPLLE